MHDSSTCPICRGLPAGGSMSDDEFFAFLAACRDEIATRQASFQQRIAGAPRWHSEMADGSLTVGAIVFFRYPSDGPVLYLAVHEPGWQDAEPGAASDPAGIQSIPDG